MFSGVEIVILANHVNDLEMSTGTFQSAQKVTWA